MAKPGPKPKPTAIKIFEGNPGKRPLNEYEPTPNISETLEYPEWMQDDCEYMQLDRFPLKVVARMIFDRLSPELVRLGVLTDIDKEMFGRYCDTFARWLKAKAFIDKNGEAYPQYTWSLDPVLDEKGEQVMEYAKGPKKKWTKNLKGMKTFPQTTLYRALAEQLRKYEEEFGIGAASRTRIQTIVEDTLKGKKEEVDEFDYAARHGLRAIK